MQVKQQCSPGASTSLLDVLFALEGMQVSERSKERDKWETCVWCSLALLQKPLPHCSGVAQSICLHHSAPKESHIWILCNHHWRCVVLSSSKWTEYFAFEFHFLQLAPVSDICLFSSVQHTLLLNVFLYSHPCYLTQRSFLFCRNTKENINNPSKWMLWLLMFYLLGGKWYFFFFQSRLSGVTTKRGRTKGTQQVVWAGARRQHKHMHTYI